MTELMDTCGPSQSQNTSSEFAHSLPGRVSYLTLHRSPLPSCHISAVTSQSERGSGENEHSPFFRRLGEKSGELKVKGEMCSQEEEVWEAENRDD